MIKADHKKWAEIIFDVYLKRLLKKSFNDFRVINALPVIDKSKSLIITTNHFSWWDGFFIYWLNKRLLNKKLHILMLEEQLKRFWFFKKLGCYSIDLNDNRKMITSLKYTLDLISNPENLIIIYPQGEIQPYEQRPIVIKEGVNYLSSKSSIDFQVLPVAFKIHHTNGRHPIIFARFGNLLSSKKISENKKIFKDEFVSNLDSLDSEFSESNYKSIF
ncbi:MAG: lysophospholipid acyltransferase family protein [Ignavibacteriota bacterium]